MADNHARPESTEHAAHRMLSEATHNHDITRELGEMQKQDPQKYNDVVKEMRREQSALPAEFQDTFTIIGDDKNSQVLQTKHDPKAGTLEQFEQKSHDHATDIIEKAKHGEAIVGMGSSQREDDIIAKDITDYKKTHPNELKLLDVGGMQEGVPFVVQGTYREELGMKYSQEELAEHKHAVEQKIHKHLHPEEQAHHIEDLASKALKGDEQAKRDLQAEGRDLQNESDGYRRKVIGQVETDGNQHDRNNPLPHAEIKRDANGEPTEIDFSKNFNLPGIGAKEVVDVKTPGQQLEEKKQQLDREIRTKTDGWNGRNGSKGMEDSIYKWIDDHDGTTSAEARRRELDQ